MRKARLPNGLPCLVHQYRFDVHSDGGVWVVEVYTDSTLVKRQTLPHAVDVGCYVSWLLLQLAKENGGLND